jgi:hypothetical protein
VIYHHQTLINFKLRFVQQQSRISRILFALNNFFNGTISMVVLLYDDNPSIKARNFSRQSFGMCRRKDKDKEEIFQMSFINCLLLYFNLRPNKKKIEKKFSAKIKIHLANGTRKKGLKRKKKFSFFISFILQSFSRIHLIPEI